MCILTLFIEKLDIYIYIYKLFAQILGKTCVQCTIIFILYGPRSIIINCIQKLIKLRNDSVWPNALCILKGKLFFQLLLHHPHVSSIYAQALIVLTNSVKSSHGSWNILSLV